MGYYKFSKRAFAIGTEVSEANSFSGCIQNLAQQFTRHHFIVKESGLITRLPRNLLS